MNIDIYIYKKELKTTERKKERKKERRQTGVRRFETETNQDKTRRQDDKNRNK